MPECIHSTTATTQSAAVAAPQDPNTSLRQSVPECFNVFQATVAMCSIFMGFVFAALLQLLATDAPLTRDRRLVVWLLVIGLLVLLGSLIGFHVTANQVLRYWGSFFPLSTARTIASVLFPIGIIMMLLAVAVMLFEKSFLTLGSIVACAAMSLVPVAFRVGSFHRGQQYAKNVG